MDCWYLSRDNHLVAVRRERQQVDSAGDYVHFDLSELDLR